MGLIEKTRSYLVKYHPDIVLSPPNDLTLAAYIGDLAERLKPSLQEQISAGKSIYQAESACVETLAEILGPSKTDYIKAILKEEFTDEFERLEQSGVLTSELIGMSAYCKTAFETFEFSTANLKDTHLRHAIIFEVFNYLFDEKTSVI
jgi:hypothetical protein